MVERDLFCFMERIKNKNKKKGREGGKNTNIVTKKQKRDALKKQFRAQCEEINLKIYFRLYTKRQKMSCNY
jgi:hypothetical protein